ncbi:DUF2188 domain-containing protein [Fulvivirga maritima]|uniref:DUF2188 domain-containing protein n=1 Tax=Fulvivirga maritima TaxID=2904247 RepID=UPI001F40BA05|nr:DUF2188 domain-containing protein [Fulvivirga maritima]UII27402.1 DUF2188 domain-containing protein [Fulvivirga maritima]
MENYHLTKEGDHWNLTKEGNSRASKSFETNKEEAIKSSASYVNSHGGGSLKIHKLNGQIEEERTYPRSADPTDSPG